MGVAHYTWYVWWFETARIEWLRRHGLGYPFLEPDGPVIPVTELEAAYLAPARFDDLLTVEASLAHVSPARLTFAYRITQEDRLLARGFTGHAFLDRSGRPLALPRAAPALYRVLEEAAEADAGG